jgi:hypothetical protein
MLARSTSWACKSLGMWDKQEVSSQIFFYAVIRTIKNFEKAESGDKEAKKRTMRKLFLFLLCTLSSFSMKATDYGKNITKASAMEARTKADGKTPIRDDCPTPDNGTTKKIFKVKRVCQTAHPLIFC